MRHFKRTSHLALLGLLAGGGPVLADAGVPMLAVVWPISWLLLLPIVIVEALVAQALLDLEPRQSLVVAAKANVASTLIGIPLTWLLLLLVELLLSKGLAYGLGTPTDKLLAFTLQAPWLIPYEGSLHWLVPAAAIVLCVPFFIVSVFTERAVVRRLLPQASPSAVTHWSWRANLITYGFVLCALAVIVAISLARHGLYA